jgi:hypothetical protein
MLIQLWIVQVIYDRGYSSQRHRAAFAFRGAETEPQAALIVASKNGFLRKMLRLCPGQILITGELTQEPVKINASPSELGQELDEKTFILLKEEL